MDVRECIAEAIYGATKPEGFRPWQEAHPEDCYEPRIAADAVIDGLGLDDGSAAQRLAGWLSTTTFSGYHPENLIGHAQRCLEAAFPSTLDAPTPSGAQAVASPSRVPSPDDPGPSPASGPDSAESSHVEPLGPPYCDEPSPVADRVGEPIRCAFREGHVGPHGWDLDALREVRERAARKPTEGAQDA